jgi:hypothetical protein
MAAARIWRSDSPDVYHLHSEPVRGTAATHEYRRPEVFHAAHQAAAGAHTGCTFSKSEVQEEPGDLVRS